MRDISLNSRKGFTLIELMIAMVLGLLVLTATVRILLSSSQSSTSQQAGSDAVNDEVFGASILYDSIIMANYGASSATSSKQDRFVINNLTPFGGVVTTAVTAQPTSILEVNLMGFLGAAPTNFLTSESSTLSASSFGGNSDQLVVQHAIPANSSEVYDCTGRQVSLPANYDPLIPVNTASADVNQPRFLVERYFVRNDSNTALPGEPSSLSLVCAAGVYFFNPVSSRFEFQGSGAADLRGSGSVLIGRVDHFNVLLGVNPGADLAEVPDNNNIRYLTAAQYQALSSPRRRIVSVQVGLVTRSSRPIPANSSPKTFNVLGENLTLTGDTNYGRQVLEKTIMIRNGRG